MAGDVTKSQLNALWDNIHRLEKEVEIQRGIATLNHRAYERCGVINRELRSALQTCELGLYEYADSDEAAGRHQAAKEMRETAAIAKRGLGFMPAKAEARIAAMEKVIEQARKVASEETPNYLSEALAEYDEILKEEHGK